MMEDPMDTSEALTVVRALADGVDPVTGEIFPPDSAFQRAHTVRALMVAAEALAAARGKRAHLPQKTGKPWTDVEDERLRAGYANGLSVVDLAAEHHRTTGGIRARLLRNGLDPERLGAPAAPAPALSTRS
jgi:hypothetical protein